MMHGQQAIDTTEVQAKQNNVDTVALISRCSLSMREKPYKVSSSTQ